MRLAFAALCLAVLCPLLAGGCLVFLPRKYPDGNWAAEGPAFEDAWFEAPDGVRLHGWFAAAPRPRAVILYAHGNGGNVTSLRPALRFFPELLQASILVFDYRGYGRSEGAPSEKGILADARAARRWLARRAGVAEKDIVLLGRSLGGGVAVDLAAREGARGLILENTFTSVPDVAVSHAGGLPVGWLFSTRLDSLARIRDYHGPLLQTHGDDDRVVPFALGEKLFAAANEPKQFVRVPGGGHNDPPSHDYLRALDRFLGSLPPPSGRPGAEAPGDNQP
jgi:fermentation-respiration switch protein FrsA (DUF1100 family)